MIAAPDFDADWSSPADWVGLYRSLALQVVPCHEPAGPDDEPWKHPKLATWKQFATDPIPDSQYERWYRPGGEFARSPQMGAILGEASERAVCVDLDTIKCPQAAAWWQGLIVVENYGQRARDLESSLRKRRPSPVFQIPAWLRHADEQDLDRRGRARPSAAWPEPSNRAAVPAPWRPFSQPRAG